MVIQSRAIDIIKKKIGGDIPSMTEPDKWGTYVQSQQWRVEPEVSEKRKKELADLRNRKADIQDGMFPFSS